MGYHVNLMEDARREIRSLPGNMLQRILKALHGLEKQPRPSTSRPLDMRKVPITISELEPRRMAGNLAHFVRHRRRGAGNHSAGNQKTPAVSVRRSGNAHQKRIILGQAPSARTRTAAGGDESVKESVDNPTPRTALPPTTSPRGNGHYL